MNKLIYNYKTPVGTFIIKPIKNKPNSFGLYINDEFLISSSFPSSLADEVRSQNTGYDDWDDLNIGTNFPTDLGDWEAGLP